VFQYWPEEKGTPMNVGEFTITLTDIEIAKENTTRRLELTHNPSSETSIVNHIQYTNWPDHGVPRYSTSFLQLLEMSDELNLTKG
jgi:protein tyrosine phosphatase